MQKDAAQSIVGIICLHITFVFSMFQLHKYSIIVKTEPKDRFFPELKVTDLEQRLDNAFDLEVPCMLNISRREWRAVKEGFRLVPPLTGTPVNQSIADLANIDWREVFGLKWCGPGTRDKDEDDLGFEWEIDSCCRTHHKCSLVIQPGTFDTRCNFNNTGDFAVSGCDCDLALVQCLKNLHTIKANLVGYLFSVFMKQCIVEDALGCKIVQNDAGVFFANNLTKEIISENGRGDDFLESLKFRPPSDNICFSPSPLLNGTNDLKDCIVSCHLGKPAQPRIEYLETSDCSLMALVCCEQESDWCLRSLPPAVETICPSKTLEGKGGKTERDIIFEEIGRLRGHLMQQMKEMASIIQQLKKIEEENKRLQDTRASAIIK